MMKLFLLTFFPMFITTCFSKCVKETFNLQTILLRPRASRNSLEKFSCTNLTESLEFKINYEVSKFRQELWITDSIIPTLHSNSSLSKFSHIKSLHVNEVGLEKIQPGAFDGLVQLKDLNLASNKLKKIESGTFNNLPTLETLNLAKNKIKEIQDGGFSGLHNLTSLEISQNQLKSFQKDLFSDLKNLESLWISENPLTEFFFSNFPKLDTLIAIQTELKSLDLDFTKSPMGYVKFTKGYLEGIDFGIFGFVEHLLLDENKISSVQNWNKLNCKRAFLRHNRISSFDISENVEKLFLTDNRITSFRNTFSGKNKKLEELLLDYNRISEISDDSFRGLTELQILNLNDNDLEILRENTFINAPRIRKLYFANNKIRTVEGNAFKGLENLDHLDLSGNDIKNLKSPVFSEIKKANLILGNVEIDWGYVESLIGNSDDLSLQVDDKYWVCEYLENTDRFDIKDVKYITKHNIKKIRCHLKNK